MPFTSGDIAVTEIDAKRWQLIDPVVYAGETDTFTVPKGFVTDFASVPRIFFWLFPSYGTYTKAAVLHDYLCDTAVVSRDDADGIFRRAMRELGVPFVRRWIMWAAVRLGAGLKGTHPAELVIWLLVTIPSVIFLLIPGIVVLVWLFLFWLIELVFYVALKPFSRKQVNPPRLLPSRPAKTAEPLGHNLPWFGE